MSNAHPILFSGAMVRAILEGRKSQTRRVVKGKWIPTVEAVLAANGRWVWSTIQYDLTTPHGQPGDRLWVRETWASRGVNPVARPSGGRGAAVIEYRADGIRATWDHDPIQRDADDYWRPSIFMPRWASRITLEITEVRVQRLQEISPEDCVAEGIYPSDAMSKWSGLKSPVETYRELWDHLNAKRGFGWSVNPWVWCLTFRRLP